MRQLDEALEQVRASRSEDDGLIRLTAPPSLGSRVLVPLVKGFREQHPGIGFDVVLSDLFTDLVEARIDVGFRVGTSPGQNLWRGACATCRWSSARRRITSRGTARRPRSTN